MNGLSGLYGQQYSSIDPQRSLDGYAQDDGMDAMDTSTLDATVLGQSQSLDQIVDQNNQLMHRRRTFQPQYRQNGHTDHTRRASMLEFSSSMNSELADFQFDPNPVHAAMSRRVADLGAPQKSLDPRKVRSRENLALDTRFDQMDPSFENMPNATSYSPAVMSATAGATTSAINSSSAFIPSSLDMHMDFDATADDTTPVALHPGAVQSSMFTSSPVHQNFAIPYPPSDHDPGGGGGRGGRGVAGGARGGGGGGGGGGGSGSPHNQEQLSRMTQSALSMNPPFPNKHPQMRRNPNLSNALSVSQGSANNNVRQTSPLAHSTPRRQSMEGQSSFPSTDLTGDSIQQYPQIQHQTSTTMAKHQNVYSSSGFDMLGVLMRVATRPNPEINIGPVDLSCAFVVVDIDKHDLPIVYCSDMFERLTGYTRYEILGRNCRFLQAPDGKVQSGVKRKYVNDEDILLLKNRITQRAEAQISLINYRKGGQSFVNLLTTIPITWDTDEFKYYVGFQVDLVEQPNSVSGKNPDGTYAINYNRSALPAYALPPPPDPSSGLQGDLGQTVTRDEVSQVLSTIGSGESELSKRIWDKVLLENTDDVVHVLSLKGLFLYLSPASRKVLEYDASELIGTALSAICHPSDIVPVTRELKDSSSGSPVNVVYRIRRKNSGYTWFEAHGCLHTEQGKGRKCIILVGRERPVYALDKTEITAEGVIGESELWSKLSTAGMFLYVSPTSRTMLDQIPEDLVGTSMQNLMRQESKKEFLRLLEIVRCGETVTFKHDLQNRRGQVLQAQTTIYPGDARQGFKPTFILAQTRLLKMSRATLLHQKSSSSNTPKTEHASVASGKSTTPVSSHGGSNMTPTQTPSNKPGSTSLVIDGRIVTSPGGNALPLGNQDEALASEYNIFDELKTTRSTSWQFELRQMERQNRVLSEELQNLLSAKKRRRRKGSGQMQKDCANCHTNTTPEWRRGPSGNRDLCNGCGLRWAKQHGRVSPRKYSSQSDMSSMSPVHASAGDASKATKTNFGRPESAQAGAATSDSPRASMPPKIEEAEEPPHPMVLPA